MVKFLLTSDTHYGMNGKTDAKHKKFWKKVAKAIEDENVQAMIWAGDLASTKQRNLRQSIEMVRQLIDIPILLVFGNHDKWDAPDKKNKNPGPNTLEYILEQQKLLLKKHNIHHLEGNPFVIDDVIVCGFDGWYASNTVASNDHKYMPKFIQGQPFVSDYLVGKAWKDFQDCLDVDVEPYRKSVIVTHHNLSPYQYGQKLDTVDKHLAIGSSSEGMSGNFKFLVEIRQKFDVLCYGHTHQYRNDTTEGIQMYNSGSDYNDPKFLIFEV